MTAYYVFKPDTIVWRDKLLYAHILGGRPSFPEYDGYWWGCTPLLKPLPHLKFTVNASAPKLDNYNTGTEFDLYTERLISAIHDANVHFESFPVTIVDQKTKQPLPERYQIFHLLQDYPAFDEQQTKVSRLGVERIVLTEEFLTSQKLLVRVKQKPNIVLIHSRLKDKLELMGITGCEYIPVDEYGMSRFEARVFGKNSG